MIPTSLQFIASVSWIRRARVKQKMVHVDRFGLNIYPKICSEA